MVSPSFGDIVQHFDEPPRYVIKDLGPFVILTDYHSVTTVRRAKASCIVVAAGYHDICRRLRAKFEGTDRWTT